MRSPIRPPLVSLTWFRFLLLPAMVWVLGLPRAEAANWYVWQSSPANGPGTNWASAFHEIQGAVDAAAPGDTVLVTNGLYATGGRVAVGAVTNRVAVTKPILVASLRGPSETLISGNTGVSGYNNGNGDGAIRCVYVTNGAVVAGFTLTNGHTQAYGTDPDLEGGGACCETSGVLSNCVVINSTAMSWGGGVYRGRIFGSRLSGNVAAYGAGAAYSELHGSTLSNNVAGIGGGAFSGSLDRCLVIRNVANGAFGGGGMGGATATNCLVISNTASYYGGGAQGGSLYNCTLVGNRADTRGGGAYDSTLLNCLVYYNTSPMGSNWMGGTLDFCCASPQPTTGTANIGDDPRLLNPAAMDYRLRIGSPCIDAGLNLDSLTSDFEGGTRPVDGTGKGYSFFDIGAYEYNARTVDSDGDGATDWQEYVMDTDPTNTASCLRVTAHRAGSRVDVSFQSSGARRYTLYSAANAWGAPWTPVAGQVAVAGTGGTLTLSETNLAAAGFYRMQVQLP